MKVDYQVKILTSVVLIISLIFGSFSVLIVEASESAYTLQDSKVLDDNGDWVKTGRTYNSHFQNYNCYAYAIGRVESKFYNINAGLQYQPGDIFTNIECYDAYLSDNIDLFRCTVIKDLNAMGYTNIEVSYNVMPTISENKELICLRMGYKYIIQENEKIFLGNDYHFMRYDYYTQAWYHKPGTSAILKYVNEDGILQDGSLATNVPWSGEGVYEDGNARDREGNLIEYTGDIVYITYDKHQIIVPDNGTASESITIQGGNDFNCCTNGTCCCGRENCNHYVDNGYCCCGIFSCGYTNQNTSSGKDVIYEIVIPESGDYTIQITTPTVTYNETSIANFNYEIYSYNMYNGDYDVLKSGSGQSGSTFTETVNLTAYDDYNDGTQDWQYQAYKHYIRLDFGRANTTDQSVNVSITHQHEYTHNYEKSSILLHKAYCWCGDFEYQEHDFSDGACTLCNLAHNHEYDSWVYYSNTYHIEKCSCGNVGTKKSVHAVRTSEPGRYKQCVLCGATVDTFSSPSVILSKDTMVTENGSFILPNGIIVLANEDMEAYFDGTLEFQYPDDNLETE